MKRVTIKDIAKKLNLSTSTVSRAIIGDRNIKRETKEAVLKAANELGYRPNTVARTLKTGLTNTVGVLVPEMVTPCAAMVIEGVQSFLYPQGIKVILADSREDPERELDNMKVMERFMVDGIIMCQCDYRRNTAYIDRLQKNGMPMVFFDRIPFGLDVPQVIIDDYLKSFFLVERLIRAGHRKIVHLKGPDSIYNSEQRYKGYLEAMNKFSIPVTPEMVIETGMGFADGVAAADKVIEQCPECDCITAYSDLTAIGLMNRLRALGHRIPEDFAVACFSGTMLSTMMFPQLTTVEPPYKQMGEIAAEMLLKSISEEDCDLKSVTLNADIHMRSSSHPSEDDAQDKQAEI